MRRRRWRYTSTERGTLGLRHAAYCAASEHGLSTVRVARVAVLFAVRYDSILQRCADTFRMRWRHGDMRTQAVACKTATSKDTVTKHSVYSIDAA
eukprot:COSAG02_NODE_48450_length_333_cov_1.606838_1_plen_94_part_10